MTLETAMLYIQVLVLGGLLGIFLEKFLFANKRSAESEDEAYRLSCLFPILSTVVGNKKRHHNADEVYWLAVWRNRPILLTRNQLEQALDRAAKNTEDYEHMMSEGLEKVIADHPKYEEES